MATIDFWEKPGCGGNARQKELLLAAGHCLIVHDLLTTAWTPDTLRPFFGALPVADWFNRASKRLKSGELDPVRFDEASALQAMVADPLLIRRPLLQVGEQRQAGFDTEKIAAWIGLASNVPPGKMEGCLREGMAPCPAPQENKG
jgi:nitrogenase-associated protein